MTYERSTYFSNDTNGASDEGGLALRDERERTSTYLSTAHTTETGGNVNLALEAVNVKVLATDGERGRGSYRPALRMVMVVPWTMP